MKWPTPFPAAAMFLFVAALAWPRAGQALPKAGHAAPESASVEDVDARVLTMKALRGKPVLVVYEDKDSAHLNDTLKKELASVGKNEPPVASIGVVAVADVSGYDFFPAKGAVKDAIRKEQEKAKTIIWLDWTARFRKDLALDEGTSNVVLVDAQGKVVFAASGALDKAAREKLFDAMRGLTRA
jgi:hypothetical protein